MKHYIAIVAAIAFAANAVSSYVNMRRHCGRESFNAALFALACATVLAATL